MKFAVIFLLLSLFSLAKAEEVNKQAIEDKIGKTVGLSTVMSAEVKYKISQIDNNSNVIAVKNDPPLESAIEKEFIVQDESGRQCSFPITEVKGEFLIASTKDCIFSKDLRAEQVLALSVITGFSKKDVEKKEPVIIQNQQSREVNQNESWYTKFNFGIASVTYPDYLQVALDRLDSSSEVTHIPIALDFGIYWPIKQTGLLGVATNMIADRYSVTINEYLQINQYLLGPSFIYFFGKFIGDGFFVRGDIGLAWYNVSASSLNYSVNQSTHKGFGSLGAIGYSIPTSSEARVLFELSLSNRKPPNAERLSTVAGTIGFLW